MKNVLLAILMVGLMVSPVTASFFDIYTEVATDSVHYPPAGGSPYMQMNAQRVGNPLKEEMVRYSFGTGTTGVGAMRAVNRDDGDPINPQPTSFFDIFLEGFSSSPSFRIDSFFDVFCSSGAPGQVGDIVVSYFVPDSFFDVFLEMYVPSAGGEQVIKIHGELNPSQPVGLSTSGSTVTTGTYRIDSFFDIFTEIFSTNNDGENFFVGYDFNQPLMTMSMEIVPEPASICLLVLGGLAVLRRRA